jgi:acyl transferase domain-containing protein/NAD(P)-dependent dehydrogenase (short-subunit alcohol dehydrogenase family)
MPNLGPSQGTNDESGLLNRPLAIVGMACRLPGADGLEQFWQLLSSGSSAIERMPDSKLNRPLYFDPTKGRRGKTYSDIGGFISDREFDWSLLPFDRKEARDWDECHLTLCETVASACKQAGWDPRNLPIRKTGVFVGHSGGSTLGGELAFRTLAPEFVQLMEQVPGLCNAVGNQDQFAAALLERIQNGRPMRSADGKPLVEAGFAAGIISHAFGLTGPHMSIDAACASSLVALALASASLQTGQVDAAIVGGASYNKSDSMILFSNAQSCSATGSRPFDEAADGLVSSEGYVAIIVKTLQRAIADGDRIQAVIHGIGVSTDGRGKSLWAPRREGQYTAIRRAYSPEVTPDSIQMIEAHATSTQVGDATEMEALSQFFAEHCKPGQRIPVGSVKSNIGHTLESAGLAGLIKAVLSIQRSTIPPSINVRNLNQSIAWSEIPLFVPNQCQMWPTGITPDAPRRAAVNAFGIGGLNVHVVVEQYVAERLPRMIERQPKRALEPIAVVGRGLVVPGAMSVDELRSLIASGRSQIGPRVRSTSGQTLPGRTTEDHFIADPSQTIEKFSIRAGETVLEVPLIGGHVRDFQYDWRKHKVPPKQISQANPLQFMLLEAAEQALRESGCLDHDFDRQNTAVVVGSIFGGEFGNSLFAGLRLPELSRHLYRQLREYGVADDRAIQMVDAYEAEFLKVYPALLDETGSFTASTLASRLSKTFDLMGGAMAIDCGETSSFAALHAACQLLQSRSANQVLCAAAHRALDRASLESLALHGRLPNTQSNRNGHYVGEGVAVVVLKRLSDAILHGDRVLATIDDLSFGFDSRSLENSYRITASRLISESRSTKQICGLTGVPASDQAIDRGLRAALAESISVIPSPLLPITGHLQGAQGLVDLINSTMDNRSQAVADASLLLVGSTRSGQTYAVNVWPGERQTTDPNYLSNGNPSHAVVPDAIFNTASGHSITLKQSTDARIWRLAGSNLIELKKSITEALHDGENIARHNVARFDASNAWRAAIVCDDTSLADKLTILSAQLSNSAARIPLAEQGIFWSSPDERTNRVAWVFPGQGSQYAGMLSSLVARDPVAARALKMADALLLKLGQPAFEQLAGSLADNLGEDVWYTQAAMLVADWVLLECMRERGHQPYLVTGHSYGEFAAMLAAECWDLETALRATWHRCQTIVRFVPPGFSMLSIQSSPQQVAEVLHSEQLPLSISHINTAQQVVVGGKRSIIVQFSQMLDVEGISSRVLAVPTAFHTPALVPAQNAFRQQLQSLVITPPRRPFLSSVTNRYEADPQQLAENLVQQLTSPIDFSSLCERMVKDGVGLAIEVGPQQVLSRLVRQNVGNAFTVVATDHAKRGAEFQLLCADANVELYTDAAVHLSTPLQIQSHAVQSHNGYRQAAVHFDATQTRRDRMRNRARAVEIESQPEVLRHNVLSFDATDIRRTANLRNSIERAVIDTPATLASGPSIPQATQFPQLELVAAESVRGNKSTVESSERAAKQLSSNFVETFLVDFVVEQTGYPAEIIEMDWDIEADLGIDSIKKAQLFGELREFFDLESIENFSLDRFKTLRDISELLAITPGKGDWLDKAQTQTIPEQTTEPVAAVLPATASQPSRFVQDGMQSQAAVATPEFLQQFLIDFVVEQTGYPEEIVELDADLEADLGIDSIKKAQLFGELREMFQFGASESETSKNGNRQSLASYRTLRDVQQVLLASKSTFRTADATDPSLKPGVNSEAMKAGDQPAANVAILEPTVTTRSRIELQNTAQLREARRQVEAQSNTAAAMLVKPRQVAVTVPVSDDNRDVIVESTQRSDDTPGPTEVGKSIASRYLLQMVPSAQRHAPGRQPIWSGPALIVGSNAIAIQLEARLRLAGVSVTRFQASDDQDLLAHQFEQLLTRQSIHHLFLTTPCDPDAGITLEESRWNTRRNKGILGNFWLCQRWLNRIVEGKLTDAASLVAVTAQGGDFGISGNTHSAEGGALAGLLKSILIESWMQGIRTLPIKVIDSAPQQSPSEVIDYVWRELAIPSYDLEVAYPRGVRHVVRASPKAIDSPTEMIPTGGTWICTGGARGITAYVAEQLGRRYQLKLHLIGTAETPRIDPAWRCLSEEGLRQLRVQVMTNARTAGKNPVKAWQNTEKALEIDATMRRFAQLGIEAYYHSCDVANRSALKTVLAEVRSISGPIEGVLHGAGVGKDARFDRKQRDKVEQCIAAKVDGTLALMEATKNDPLKYFVGFGSISGRFGANGHTDYSLANETLCKLISWLKRQRPDVRAVGFHWHAWGDVGMATKPETKLALEMIDMQFMPADEGIRHLINELESDSQASEVLITDDRYYRSFYPSETLVGSSGNHGQNVSTNTAMPFLKLDANAPTVSNRRSYIAEVDPGRDPFLTEHKLDNVPLLPFVVATEMMFEAAIASIGTSHLSTEVRHAQVPCLVMKDIEAIQGLRFFSSAMKSLRLETQVCDKDTVTCTLYSDFLSRDGRLVEANRVHFKSTTTAHLALGQRVDLQLPGNPHWVAPSYPAIGESFYLGWPFQKLRQVTLLEHGLIGRISAPALIELAGTRRDLRGWRVPCAAMDACLFAAGVLAWQQAPGTALPVRMGQLEIGRLPSPGEACQVHVQLLRYAKGQASFDFTLYGIDGDVILNANDYQVAWLNYHVH